MTLSGNTRRRILKKKKWKWNKVNFHTFFPYRRQWLTRWRKVNLGMALLVLGSVEWFFPFVFRYGDKTPKSLLARIYSAVWMILGMIILSMFTAEVTSRMTSKEMMPHHMYLGKKVILLPFILLWAQGMIEGGKAGPKHMNSFLMHV